MVSTGVANSTAATTTTATPTVAVPAATIPNEDSNNNHTSSEVVNAKPASAVVSPGIISPSNTTSSSGYFPEITTALSPNFNSTDNTNNTPNTSSGGRFGSISPTLSNIFGSSSNISDQDNFIFNLPSPKDLDLENKNEEVVEEMVNRKIQKSPSPSNALISINNRSYSWSPGGNSPNNNNSSDQKLQNWISEFFDNNGAINLSGDGTNSPLSNLLSPSSIPQSLSDDHAQTFNLFDKFTCGILSIKDGPTENPWRSVLWPLAQDYGALYHAVGAMTKFHTARQVDQELRTQAVQHMKKSFDMLGEGLSKKTLPPDVALATTLSLAFAEAWDRHISTGISHLRGATEMLRQLIDKHKNMPLPPWLQFLFNSWLYLDVLARLTAEDDETPEERLIVEAIDDEQGNENNETNDNENDDDDNNKQQQHFFNPSAPEVNDIEKLLNNQVFEEESNSSPERATTTSPVSSKRSRSREGSASATTTTSSNNKKRKPNTNNRFVFKDHLFNNQREEVDPLMGCGQTLFPIIGKVASLVQRVRKLKKNTLSIVSEAVELKHQLETWNATLSKKMTMVEDPTWDLNSCLSTAEAYRYSALLYLHQAVPEVPSLHAHELAEKVMMLLASIPSSSGCWVVSIFPLLIAGCEAEDEERNWVRERWQLLSERMWIGNIDRTVEVVKEVWARKDYIRREQERKKQQKLQQQQQQQKQDDLIASDNSNISTAGSGIAARRSSKDIASSIASRVAQAFGSDHNEDEDSDPETDSIKGWCHWSIVMKEWGWEVLLG